MAVVERAEKASRPKAIESGQAKGRVGVVDIGSNTVRLVVYETPTRVPIPIFNEKAQCALGAGMSESGKLNPKGVTSALQSLARFVRLSQAMGVEHLELVATAAVREASDGPEFVERAERTCGRSIHVLSGAEEARLAAVGLLHGFPGADGVLGDLGGGSLDLVGLDVGSVGMFATLPLGHLRLLEASGGDRKAAKEILVAELSQIPWLSSISGRTLFAVGGSWRALARIFIEQTHHPLHVIDNYTIDFFGALRLASLIGGLSITTLEQLSSVAQRRIDTLPYASMALAALIEISGPSRVVFSAFGMREGQMLELLPPSLRHQDPLISACESQAERTGRFATHGQEILDWMSPLFDGETEGERRLRLATCLLSDIGWSEHPDYRSLHAYHRVLRVPYAGLTHSDRAQMAMSVLVRYNGDTDAPMVRPHQNLLDEDRRARAQAIGLALRLAHTMSGGAPGVLAQTALKIKDQRLALIVPGDDAVFVSEAVQRQLKALARALDLKPTITEKS